MNILWRSLPGLALCLSLFGLTAGESPGLLRTLDGTREGALAGWPAEGPLPLARGESLPRDDFRSWTRGRIASAQAGQVQVILANGVSLRGQVTQWTAEGIHLDNYLVGGQDLKYDALWAILFLDNAVSYPLQERLEARLRDLPSSEEDLLVLARDHVEGILDLVDAEQLHFAIAGEIRAFALSEVHGVRFARPNPVYNLPIKLTARDGTLLPISALHWGQDLTGASTLGPFKLPLHELARLEVVNPRHHYLGDLKPVRVEESLPGQDMPGPYPYGFRVNCNNYYQRPLYLDGQLVPFGLGVHADSRLTWQLPPGTRELAGACGLEAMALGEGSVHFRVRGDGKLLFDSKLMTGVDPARRFRVALKGTRELTLECLTDPEITEPREKNITLDRAVWAELILVVG